LSCKKLNNELTGLNLRIKSIIRCIDNSKQDAELEYKEKPVRLRSDHA